eukprot:993027_1
MDGIRLIAARGCLFGGGTELTCEVFDATRGTEQMTGFRGGHESCHGGYDDSDVGSRGGFELADDPGSEGLEGFDGTGVRCGSSTVGVSVSVGVGGGTVGGASGSRSSRCIRFVSTCTGGGHGGTCGDEDEGEAECGTRLGKDISTSALEAGNCVD